MQLVTTDVTSCDDGQSISQDVPIQEFNKQQKLGKISLGTRLFIAHNFFVEAEAPVSLI